MHKVTHPFSSKGEKQEHDPAAPVQPVDEQAAAAQAQENKGESKVKQAVHKVAHPMQGKKEEKKSPLGQATEAKLPQVCVCSETRF
jgi:hypothetical protein